MNVFYVIYMGGVWEYQIRIVRNIFIVLLSYFGFQVDDEFLCIFFVEVEVIVNCYLFIIDDLNSVDGLVLFVLCQLLIMKFSVVLFSFGVF